MGKIIHVRYLKNFLEEEFTYKFLVVSIVLTTLAKLCLIGNGFLAFPDEYRHIVSGHALKEIQAGNFQEFLIQIFNTQGRPGDTLLKMIPNAMQYVSAQILGLEYFESNNSFPVFFFNFIIYCLFLRLHFKLSDLLLQNKILALFSVLTFGCLINSYIYLRHGLPYDTSLLLLYFIFYRTLKITIAKDFNFSKIFFLGFFAFFGYLCYPGYFLFYMGIGLLFFCNNLTKNEIIERIKWSFIFLFGSVFCLVIFESASRYAGTSYLQASQTLSGTLDQGSFEECFSFIFKYLFEVEKMNGIFLIISLVLFPIIAVKQFKNRELTGIIFLVFSSLFLVFAGAGYFFEKVILSGRVLHQFIPLICIFLAFAVNYFALNKKAIAVISSLFIGNFLIQLIDYKNYSYPRDVSWKYYKKYYPKEISDYCEIPINSWSILPINEEELEKFSKKSTNTKITIINSCIIFPFPGLEGYSEFKPEKNQKLLFSETSYLNFEGYKFEGYSIENRENLEVTNLKVKVYIENIP